VSFEPLEPGETDYSQTSVGMTDADLRNTMLSAIRLLAILCLVVMALFWWKSGWQAALLVVIGSAISMASLWEWLRLMTALNERMDAAKTPGHKPSPMGMVLFGFFARLGLTVVVLYVSLKYLHGTAFALAAGLGLGVLSLTIEALRLMKRWTK
jgi:hypothetical protein